MHYKKKKSLCNQHDSPIVQDLHCFIYTYTGCGTQATEYYICLSNDLLHLLQNSSFPAVC